MNMAAPERFEIPSEMRAFAEKSVEQARQAFDGFISAAHGAVNAFEGQAETARKSTKDVTQRAMTFAEQNVASSFELAEQLVRAKDVQEVMKLQADFIKNQMQVLSEQASELGQRTTEAAQKTTEAAKSAAAPKR
jgi:phasin